MTVVEEQLEIPFPGETVTRRLAQVLELIEFQGILGGTVAEVREYYRLHHGQASSALSTLHQQGRIVRLAEKRQRCSVYVTPGNVAGRDTVARGRAVGRAVGPTDVEVAEAFQQGRRNGREDALGEALRFAVVLRETVLADTGNMPKRHDSQCFKQHPECALKAVVLHTQRAIQANAQP